MQESFDEEYMLLSFDGDIQGLFALCYQHPDLFFEKITTDKTVSLSERLQFLAFLSGNDKNAWVREHASEIERKIIQTREDMVSEKDQRVRNAITFHKEVGSSRLCDALRIMVTVRNAEEQSPYGQVAESPRPK